MGTVARYSKIELGRNVTMIQYVRHLKGRKLKFISFMNSLYDALRYNNVTFSDLIGGTTYPGTDVMYLCDEKSEDNCPRQYFWDLAYKIENYTSPNNYAYEFFDFVDKYYNMLMESGVEGYNYGKVFDIKFKEHLSSDITNEAWNFYGFSGEKEFLVSGNEHIISFQTNTFRIVKFKDEIGVGYFVFFALPIFVFKSVSDRVVVYPEKFFTKDLIDTIMATVAVGDMA